MTEPTMNGNGTGPSVGVGEAAPPPAGGSRPGRVAAEASPMSISLRPDPPHARRLSKRMGFLALGGIGLLVIAVFYGILTRQQEAGNFGRRTGYDPDSRVLGAKDAGKLFTNPGGTAESTATSDTLEPPPLTVVQRRGVTPGAAQPRGAVEIARAGAAKQAGARPLTAAPPVTGYTGYPGRQGGGAAGGSDGNGPDGVPAGWASPAAFNNAGGPNGIDAGGLGAIKDRTREAMDAGTGINGARAGGMPTAQGDVQELAGLMNSLGGANAANAAGGGRGPQINPMSNNMISGAPRAVGGDDEAGADQDAKRSFLAAARKGADNNYVQSTRVKALSAYEVKAGWDIPAALEQEINSDLPGEIRALVRENVFDTATGQYLLIPQGSRLVGEYDSKVAFSQSALLVAWSRIIFPDGSSVDLEGMGSQDVRGRSGLRGDVNRHYGRIFGTAALSSAFSIAAVLAQTRRQQGVFTYPSSGDIAASAAGSEIARLGAAVTRRNLSIQPTIRIPTGTRFSVRVHKDLMFQEPYRPYPQPAPRPGTTK